MKPKLDFVLSISQSKDEVVLVTETPLVLTKSLNNYLKPSFSLLNSVTGSNPNTLSVLKCNPHRLNHNIPKSFLLNTQFLLTLSVPHSQTLKMLRTYGQVLGTTQDKFRNVVLKLVDMGFDLKSSYFLHALHSLAYNNNST